MSVQAVWNDVVLAESDETVLVEGNHYFPPDAIHREFFKENTRHTICPWKGLASYYDIEVEDKVNHSAAWYYAQPSPAASHIQDYVAFWNGVKVRKVSTDGEVEQGLLKRTLDSVFGG